VLLGRGASDDKVDHWLRAGAPVDGFIGFAIGRSIWWEPAEGLPRQVLEPRARPQQIADNYLRFIAVYEEVAQESAVYFSRRRQRIPRRGRAPPRPARVNGSNEPIKVSTPPSIPAHVARAARPTIVRPSTRRRPDRLTRHAGERDDVLTPRESRRHGAHAGRRRRQLEFYDHYSGSRQQATTCSQAATACADAPGRAEAATIR
jgi:hypothetical protein